MLSVLLVIPVAIIFFCGGVFIGSKLIGYTSNNNVPSLGLPGTNNNFIKWEGASDIREDIDPPQQWHHLRMEDAQAAVQSSVLKTEAIIDNRQRPYKATLRRVEPQSPTSNLESASAMTAEADTDNSSQPPISQASGNFGPSDLAANPHWAAGGQSLSLRATPQSYMIGSKKLDHSDVLIGAWIHLDESGGYDNDMRTVFSNKHAGCESTAGQHGISLFVNAWQQRDHKLYTEFGGTLSGCHKVDSGSLILGSGKWYHVAVYSNDAQTDLYVDGELAGSTKFDEGHQVQTENPLVIGAFTADGEYPFHGNISRVAIIHDVANLGVDVTTIIKSIAEADDQTIKSVPGIHAFYPLIDAAYGQSDSPCAEVINKRHGRYVLPFSGSTSIPGVKIPLLDGIGIRPVTDEMRKKSDDEARERRESVKNGMKHAWEGYKRYAWGRDEVKPISNRGSDNWGGMGVTLVDSLDTLWVMGMRKEFDEARDWVANSLSFGRAGTVSVFETTIRELGGLLSAFDLSGERVFLDKARELADLLMPAFNTQSGIPTGQVNFRTGSGAGGWSGSSAILSELGSLQIEFRYLAQQVKEPIYETKSMRPMQIMNTKRPRDGLYPIRISNRDGSFADSQITFGALGDSFYEYLLKIWVQGGRKETWLREMYDRAIDGVVDKLLLASEPTGLAYLADWNGRFNNKKMDHLVCFMPGTMALGAYTDPQGLQSPRAQRDLAVAKALMYTCREMYHRMATGISAEYVEFNSHHDFVPGHNAQFYILRPETAESLFYLSQLTGDPIYREWAWEIWQAIDSTCRTNTAYGAIRNVNTPGGGGIDDRMESFFLAETLKYLYLVQDPDTEIDLMKYVFNTEAHPMKIFDDSHVPIGP